MASHDATLIVLTTPKRIRIAGTVRARRRREKEERKTIRRSARFDPI
jgi:hypothetical protein